MWCVVWFDLQRFPSVFDAPSKYLSVIVPAYNEQARLPEMMQSTLSHLAERQKHDPNFTFEIILVDDGSRDRTAEVMLDYTRSHGTDVVRVLKLAPNQGKGGAVQQGMLHARGQYLLMVDADGATQFSDLDRLERDIKSIETAGTGSGGSGDGIAVGSRSHLQKNAVATRKWYRNVLMYGFHFAVAFVGGVRNVRDTQCGFKLFTRRTAQLVFASQRIRRWCFDVELLYVAQSQGVPIIECDVNWAEIPGSKLALLDSSLKMARDLIVIRLCYVFGVWKIVKSPPLLRDR